MRVTNCELHLYNHCPRNNTRVYGSQKINRVATAAMKRGACFAPKKFRFPFADQTALLLSVLVSIENDKADIIVRKSLA